MRKGDIVKLNPESCFTRERGGGLDYPLSHHHNDEQGVVTGYRPTTTAEVEAWYKSDASNGIDSAGESKLPPRGVAVTITRDEVLVVERARCRVTLGWGHAKAGMTKLMKGNGQEVYIDRELVVVV